MGDRHRSARMALARQMRFLLQKYKVLIVVAICILLFVATPLLALRYVQNGVIASYYEWAAVGIIASYTEENNGTLPQSWNDLRGYEYHSVQTPSLRSIDEAMRYVSIDFEELSRFRNSEGKDSGLPIISTKKGMNVHWVDPKYELKKFFRTGELPDGALRRSEADERRKHFEKREYKEY